MGRRERLLELRATAERLPLGEHGDRCLRDLYVELIDELTGSDAQHESIALAGVRLPAPAPDRVGVTAGVSRELYPVAQPAPVAGVADPAGENFLADLMAADKRAEEEAAAAAATPPPKRNDTKSAH